MSQPAASKLLSDLEANLGIRLFDRHPRGLTPNWYGEIMIRHAHSMLSALRHTGEELNALGEGNAGTVAVGTVMARMVTLLTSAIERVHRDRPGLKISVDVDVSKVLVPRLLEGELISRLPVFPQASMPSVSYLKKSVRRNSASYAAKGIHYPLRKRSTLRT